MSMGIHQLVMVIRKLMVNYEQSDDDDNHLPSIILLNSNRGQGQVRKGHSDVLQNYNQTWTKLRCSLSSTKELVFPGCAKKQIKKI